MSNRVLFLTVFVLGLLVMIPVSRYLSEWMAAPPVLASWSLPDGSTLRIMAEKTPDAGRAAMHYQLDRPDQGPRSNRREDRYYFAWAIPYGDSPTFTMLLDTHQQVAGVVQSVHPEQVLILLDLATASTWPAASLDREGFLEPDEQIVARGLPLLERLRESHPHLNATLTAPRERQLIQTHEGQIIETDERGVLIESDPQAEQDQDKGEIEAPQDANI